MKKTLIVAAVSASFATAASAQSSVTLYGIIDAGFTYVNNEAAPQGDSSSHNGTFRMSSGNLQGSRWGLRGQEDLGGGMKAIFTLENGFDVTNGQDAARWPPVRPSGVRRSVEATALARVTLGRQYDSVVDYIAPADGQRKLGRYVLLASVR